MAYEEKDEQEKTGKDRKAKVVAEAKERFACCVDKSSASRKKQLDDLQFLDGQQWDEGVLQERRKDGRPALVVNRMDQFVQHITNNLRQNRIAAVVFPVDDVGDPDTADVIQGHLRHIEADSDGDLAYGTAAFYAVAAGEGYWILRTRYCSPTSFDVEIYIERVPNPFEVYLDPNHRHPSGKDADYGFKISTLSKKEYEIEYPDSEVCTDWEGHTDEDGWVEEDSVRIAEYYTIERTPDTLVRMKDGSTRLKSELTDKEKSKVFIDKATGKGVERKTATEIVRWYKLNGHEVLEETVWPTVPEYCALPIIKVVGNELNIDGRQVLKGIIRNLKDAQRQYNFMLTAQTEAIDSSKSQIIVEEGQIEGHEQEWAEASKRKVLTIKSTTVDGKPVEKPTRLAANASIPSMTEARLMAADDLKALTGIYDSALGAQSNETSGRAINSRQAQSDLANYHFTGNLVRSVNHSTRLIIGAIPFVIDTPRAIRVLGQDEKQKIVKVNEQFNDNGQAKNYRIGGGGVGKYDVVCEAGPSPATQKEERAVRMTELVKVAPGLMNIAPDLILKDLGASHELVERVKKSLPPELQDEQDDKQPIPPKVKAAMDAMSKQHELLTQALNAAQQQIETKQVEQQAKVQIAQLETESRERIEALRLETQRAIAEITTKAQDSMQRAKLDADLDAKLRVQEEAHAHEVALRSAEIAHETAMADKGHEQAQEIAAQAPEPSAQ